MKTNENQTLTNNGIKVGEELVQTSSSIMHKLGPYRRSLVQDFKSSTTKPVLIEKTKHIIDMLGLGIGPNYLWYWTLPNNKAIIYFSDSIYYINELEFVRLYSEVDNDQMKIEFDEVSAEYKLIVFSKKE